MRSKRDMYINYERSYKRRGRKGGKAVKVMAIAFVAVGLGVASFFAIKNQIHIDNHGKPGQSLMLGDGSDTEIAKGSTMPKTPSITPTNIPTIVPSTDQTVSQGDSNQAGLAIGNLEGQLPGSEQSAAADTIGKVDVSPAMDTRTPVKVKGLYVTGNSAGTTKIDDLINVAASTEINALVIDVKTDEGIITYSMDSDMAKKIGALTKNVSDMPGLIKTLKEKNIYVIARIVAFKDPILAEKRHDLAIKKKNGSLYRDNKGDCWVNPYKKEVWDYLMEVAKQAAAAGFDEIQFDYIRFATGGGIENADFGAAAKSKSKEDIILDFTKYAYETLKPLGVFVSADVYGTIINSKIDAGLVGQNYVEMSKYLDYICPMIYPSHFGDGNYGIQYPDLEPYTIIHKVMTISKTKLEQIPEDEHRAIVRPWLQDFTATWLKHHKTYGGKEVKDQIAAVYDAGYEEWLLWNASTNYTLAGLKKE